MSPPCDWSTGIGLKSTTLKTNRTVVSAWVVGRYVGNALVDGAHERLVRNNRSIRRVGVYRDVEDNRCDVVGDASDRRSSPVSI